MRLSRVLKYLLVSIFGCGILVVSSLALAVEPAKKGVTVSADEVRRLGTVINYVKQLYVKEATDQQLFSGAISGMLKSLDPHSAYLDMDKLKTLFDHARGNFAGIGVEITQEKGLVKVVSPLDDTPAARAGIKPGDYIVAVNGKTLIDKPLDEATKLMRGKKGTKVTLTIISKQNRKPRKVTLTRATVNIQSVKGKLLEKGFGYIRISQFQEKTDKKLIAQVKKLRKESGGKLDGLILDLRNNPGGLLDSAVKVTNAFLDSRKLGKERRIVYTKGRTVESHTQSYATAGDVAEDAQLIVLINRGSASGSEIVAGALQDYKRAIVMGERSFGKGSVQTVFPIDNKTGIKLTTALYYTPKGREIQAHGIKPDIIVEEMQFPARKKNEIIPFWKMREADLPKHIKNGNGASEKNATSHNLQQLKMQDYQLYEALRLLKSLHVLRPQDEA